MTPEAKQVFCLKIAEVLTECLSLLETPAEQPTPAKLYSIYDLTKYFGKSDSTIRQWLARGEFGDPVQAGNKLMVTEAGLQKYISDHSSPVKKKIRKTRSRTVNTPRGPAERI